MIINHIDQLNSALYKLIMLNHYQPFLATYYWDVLFIMNHSESFLAMIKHCILLSTSQYHDQPYRVTIKNATKHNKSWTKSLNPYPQDRKVQVTVLGAVGGAAMGSTGGGVRDAQATIWMTSLLIMVSDG